MTKEVNDQDFEIEVLKSPIPVLIDFWAEWCGPCRMLGPTIDSLAIEFEGKVKVVKMNIDQNPIIPSQLGIKSIPTMLLLNSGKQLGSKVGALEKNTIISWINSLISV